MLYALAITVTFDQEHELRGPWIEGSEHLKSLQQMVVVAHQAIRMAHPVMGIARIIEQRREAHPVTIIFEDIFPAIPSRSDVIKHAQNPHRRCLAIVLHFSGDFSSRLTMSAP